MSMSKSQRIKMMAELWPNACKSQRWSPNDNQKRYDVFAQVLGNVPRHARTLADGRHISFNDFDNADFDRVKAHLLMLTGNLAAAIETDQPERGEARRLTFHARYNHIPLLKALGIEHAESYLKSILKDRFKVDYESDLSQAPSHGKDQQRGRSQLWQYLITISNRIDKMREKKGWTQHDLYTRASIDCPCLACKQSRARQQAATPVLATNSNQPF